MSRPPSSLVMRGRAVPTMLWSSAARNMPAISPPSTTRIWRCERYVGAARCGVVSVMKWLEGAASRVRSWRRRSRSASSQSARAAVRNGAALVEGFLRLAAPAGDSAMMRARPSTGSGSRSMNPRSPLLDVPADRGGVELDGLGDVAEPHRAVALQRVEQRGLRRVDGVAVDARAEAPAHASIELHQGVLGRRGVPGAVLACCNHITGCVMQAKWRCQRLRR